MKLLQKDTKNLPMLLLLAVGVIEFLFITLESRFSGIGYYLAETYLIVPCLLLLGWVLREKQEPFARRRLLLAAGAIGWFVVVQCIHKLSGMESHPMATVFFVYLMAFPFAALSDDWRSAGIRLIGGMFVASSLVLTFYSALLMLDLVPAGMKAVLYWDGARSHALWHPNLGACYYMIGIGFSAAFLTEEKKFWAKGLLLAAIVVQFLAMALTNCRTTLLLTGALLGGVAFFRIFRGNWKQFFLGLMAAAVLLAGSFKLSGMLFQWNNDRLIAAFSAAQEAAPEEATVPAEEIVTEETVQAEVPEETAPAEITVMEDTGIILGDNEQNDLSKDMRSLNGRTLIWESALTAIWENKVLALWGTEYTGTVISVYNWFPVIHAHNSWMETLLRMGIPGLLFALVFTVLSVWSAARLVLNPATELWKKTVAMLTMCLLAAGFLEPYLFITNVYYHVMDFAFFFCTGYLDFWNNRQKKQNQ